MDIDYDYLAGFGFGLFVIFILSAEAGEEYKRKKGIFPTGLSFWVRVMVYHIIGDWCSFIKCHFKCTIV